MSEDDHISRMQRHAMERFQKERSPAEAAKDFELYSCDARVQLLADLKTPAAMSVLEASRRHAMERALRSTHLRLMNAGR